MAAVAFEGIVRDAMDRRGLSMLALARASGIDAQRWYAWFRGDHRPTARSLARAAGALDLSPEDLAAPYGMAVPPTPGPSEMAALTAAINRLADVLAGRLERASPEIAEGIARARGRVAAAPRRRAKTPR